MKGQNRFFLSAVCLALLCGHARADKGDIFLSVMPVTDPIHSGEGLFGAGADISCGINERTDFQFEVDWTAQPGYFDKSGYMETRYLFESFFTPYFGDIRPRFGGSVGLIYDRGTGGLNEVGYNAGVHLQGLYDMSEAIRLFAEVNPNVSFGKSGGVSTLIKLGIQFRLSK